MPSYPTQPAAQLIVTPSAPVEHDPAGTQPEHWHATPAGASQSEGKGTQLEYVTSVRPGQTGEQPCMQRLSLTIWHASVAASQYLSRHSVTLSGRSQADRTVGLVPAA